MKIKLLVLILLIGISYYSCKDDGGSDVISTTSTRPNVLLIIADDLGIEATPNYSIGSVKPQMPNLNKLASIGITYDNVWAYPVCSPTRSSILTGKYGYRTGVLNAESASRLGESEMSLQQFIDERTSNAYDHTVIGKWHLSGRDASGPSNFGIDNFQGLLTGAVQDYFNWSFTQNGTTSTSSEYITTQLTNLAIDWIEQRNKPWFCWLAYNAPHTPLHLPPDSLHSQIGLDSSQASIDANPLPYFMAMTESIDHEIGRLLSSMSEAERENTVIIFIGDNGTSNSTIQAPYALNRGKGSLFQGGIHVPLIISGATVNRQNERDGRLISSTDLFATIAEVCGADIDTYEDSYSFRSSFSNTGDGLRKFNYSEQLSTSPINSGYTIRNERYKLIGLDNGQYRFYDLDTDPYESSNILNSNLNEVEQEAYDLLVKEAQAIRN